MFLHLDFYRCLLKMNTDLLSSKYYVPHHCCSGNGEQENRDNDILPGSNKGLPGVYFFYEVSPLHVEIEEYKLGWVRFFTSVAAVVGGVYSVMGMVDGIIFSHGRNGNIDLTPR